MVLAGAPLNLTAAFMDVFGLSSDACLASSTGITGAAVISALQFFAAAQCLLTHPYPPNKKPCNESVFDFVIVGGGTAGAALAARLATNFTVLLMEAGHDPPTDSSIPGLKSTLMNSVHDWKFTTENDGVSSQALDEGRQPQPRGRMLGGCGSLNDMVYARGFPPDYDDWAESLAAQGDKYASRWAWTNVIDYFKKTENLTDERIINDPELMKLHGRKGDIEVSGLNESSFETYVFLGAFKELGFKMVKDMTSPIEIGAGRHSHTICGGIRDSSVTAMLNKAPQSKLYVLKDAFVKQILIENSTAYGVRVTHNKMEYNFYANNEVVVTAGTFNTPKLLMLSGVGPKEHLDKFNITVHADLPVGKNLHDHVMVLNYIAADVGTCVVNENSHHFDMIRYLYDHGGPFSVVDTMAAYLALNGSVTPNVPDFAFYPSCVPVGTDFYMHCRLLLRFNKYICDKLQNVLKAQELISVAAVLLKPKSRGYVKLNSSDVFQPPAIYSGTFSDARDLDGYPEAIEVVKSIVRTEHFKNKNARYVDLEVDGCEGLERFEKVQCITRATAMSAWHSVGTAGMGAVLDARLRVRGIKGLRVADASVMPCVIRGNTNAPVIMIAEQAATFLYEEYGDLPPCREEMVEPQKITVPTPVRDDSPALVQPVSVVPESVPQLLPTVPNPSPANLTQEVSESSPEIPHSLSANNDITSSLPESSVVVSGSLQIVLESLPAINETTSLASVSSFTTPETLSGVPGFSGVPQSSSVVSEPSSGVSKPSTGVPESSSLVQEPSPEPSSGVIEPSSGVTEPSSGVTEPSSGVTETSSGVKQPSSGVTEPSSGVTEPSSGVTEPSSEITEPLSAVTETSSAVTEPSGITQPSTAVTEPSSGVTEASSGVTQQSSNVTEPLPGVSCDETSSVMHESSPGTQKSFSESPPTSSTVSSKVVVESTSTAAVS